MDGPARLLTTTAWGPTTPGGVTAVMVVSLTTSKLVAATPSKVAEVAPVNPEPEMVTGVPPVVGPLGGVMLDSMAGAT